ncbi:unnamed protein product [Lathyrus sativus]|nr:unnamed protein product [Lathyrus sativus]
MSLYLFVMCMEKLSHLIMDVVQEKKWKAIKMGRNGQWISHLTFVHNFFIMGEATEIQMQCVVEVLQNFGTMSGKEVSEEKTCILFSKKVPRRVREKLLQMLKFREMKDIGKYLGVPLKGGPLKKDDYRYMLIKSQGKVLLRQFPFIL